MDWYSRKVLSWRIYNTMDTLFCIEALEEAIEKYSTPDIFHSDQGCQFKSIEFNRVFIRIQHQNLYGWKRKLGR